MCPCSLRDPDNQIEKEPKPSGCRCNCELVNASRRPMKDVCRPHLLLLLWYQYKGMCAFFSFSLFFFFPTSPLTASGPLPWPSIAARSGLRHQTSCI